MACQISRPNLCDIFFLFLEKRECDIYEAKYVVFSPPRFYKNKHASELTMTKSPRGLSSIGRDIA